MEIKFSPKLELNLERDNKSRKASRCLCINGKQTLNAFFMTFFWMGRDILEANQVSSLLNAKENKVITCGTGKNQFYKKMKNNTSRVDRFWQYINPSKVILCLEVRQLHSLYR